VSWVAPPVVLLAVSQRQRLDPGILPRIGLWLALARFGLTILPWQQRRVPASIVSLPLLNPPVKLPAFWRADVMMVCSGVELTAMLTFLPLYRR
jgi:hypothetical protein